MLIIEVKQVTKNYGLNTSEFQALRRISIVSDKGVVSLWY